MVTLSAALCLTLALHHEARGEGYEGMLAVSDVIHNRVHDHRYPDTICEVVFEPYAFSFTLAIPERTLRKHPPEHYEAAYKVTLDVLEHGTYLGLTATHYHTTSVSPYWSKHFTRNETIGNHIFYTNNTPYK